MNQLLNFFLPHPAYAAVWTSNCMCDEVATIQGFECIFANIAQIIVYFAGLVFFIMLIRGGFSHLTSGGDPKKIAKATSILSHSIIGLIGVILAFLIITFFTTFTGIEVGKFGLPGTTKCTTTTGGGTGGGGTGGGGGASRSF